jgi:hypothetical protein
MTSGWRGRWFRGSVTFLITRAPAGWQWTGLGLGSATQPWIERWTPDVKQTNDPLPFDIPAPWPDGERFTAGGLTQCIIEQGYLLAHLAGGWVGAIVAAAILEIWSARRCGFGPRGFYYNTGPTHDQSNAFAIDFSRYRRFVPYDNIAGGTPVLAIREGSSRTSGPQFRPATPAPRIVWRSSIWIRQIQQPAGASRRVTFTSKALTGFLFRNTCGCRRARASD